MRAWDVLRLGDDDNSTAVGGGVATVTQDLIASKTGAVVYNSSLEQITCTISLNSNGTIGGDIGGAWYATQTAGIGSSYWVIVTLTSGSLTTGTIDSRASLASGQSWTVTTTGTASARVKNAVGTVQIWDAASAGNMVSSGVFSIEAYGQSYLPGSPGTILPFPMPELQ